MTSIRALLLLIVLMPVGQVFADDYTDTINLFKKAGESSRYFKSGYAYAVFPTIGKAGFGIGGAHGEGRVYRKGKYVGDTTMTQVTFGLQFGGQAFSQIIFFQNDKTFKDFTSGNFEFGAQASAVAITAGASATAGTTGSSAGAGTQQKKSKTFEGGYFNGMATFTIAKGGLMYEASIGGQKFTYSPK